MKAREPDVRSLRLCDRGKLPDLAVQRVLNTVRSQFEIYDRFVKLQALYDPNGWAASSQQMGIRSSASKEGGQVIRNVIASNVDSIAGTVAAGEVRARMLTTGADWSTQRRAKALEFYSEGMDADLELDSHCAAKFHEGALKGTGVVKVAENVYDEIEATSPMIDDIIVDEGSLQPNGWPLEMFQRHRIDKDELAAQFPESRDKILRSSKGDSGAYSRWWARWIDDGRAERNQIGMLEGWILPVGRPGQPGYVVGRHFRSIDGTVLSDEEWEETYFPFARFVWTRREGHWYGIGGAERIAGHQRRINKMNWQHDRQMDQIAVPTTYVRPADQNIAVQTRSALGTIAVCHGEYPMTIIPTAVSPEQYRAVSDHYQASFEDFGQSKLSATAMKPSGIDSGAALRELKDQTSDRFAGQEGGYEQLKMGAVWLGLMAAKRLGSKAPVYFRRSTGGRKALQWSKVDPRETKIQMQPASKLARTPAGRSQLVTELAQAGVVSQDEARRLISHPDTERALSLYTAALEMIEMALEDILDGEIVIPDPFWNLSMCVWRGQAQLNLSEQDGAPESVLEALQQFTVTAAYYLSGKIGAGQQPTAGGMGGEVPVDAMAGGPAPAPLPPGPGDMLALPPGPPQGVPQAAFAPQAMQVMPA